MPDITALLLTSGFSTGDASFYDTGSISPASNRIILAIGATLRNTVDIPSVPSLVGNGLTWIQIISQTWDHAGTDRGRISLFRAVGPSPSSGVLRFTYSETQRRHTWAVIELGSLDIGGGGADGIVQAASNKLAASLTPSVSLGAFSDIVNGVIGVTHFDGPTNPTVTPGVGFGEIIEQANSEGGGIQVQFAPVNISPVDWTLSLSQETGNIGVELRNATPSPPPPGPQQFGRPAFIKGNLIT